MPTIATADTEGYGSSREVSKTIFSFDVIPILNLQLVCHVQFPKYPTFNALALSYIYKPVGTVVLLTQGIAVVFMPDLLENVNSGNSNFV